MDGGETANLEIRGDRSRQRRRSHHRARRSRHADAWQSIPRDPRSRETPFHFWRSVVPRRRRYGAMHGSRQSSARRCNSPNRMIRPGVKAASDAGFGVAQATIIPKDLPRGPDDTTLRALPKKLPVQPNRTQARAGLMVRFRTTPHMAAPHLHRLAPVRSPISPGHTQAVRRSSRPCAHGIPTPDGRKTTPRRLPVTLQNRPDRLFYFAQVRLQSSSVQ